MEPFGASWFDRPASVVARALLGQRIESRIGGIITGGRIVETEAYLGCDDPASHAFRGRRHAGNVSIYAPPGTWYIYRSYGIHWCANLVTGPVGSGSAVLLRAILPEAGLDRMRIRRGAVPDQRLANGPGKLTQALGIARELDGVPMPGSSVAVLPIVPLPESLVQTTPRVGISKAIEWELRYVVVGGWDVRREK